MVKVNIVSKVFDFIRNIHKDIKSCIMMNNNIKKSDSFV